MADSINIVHVNKIYDQGIKTQVLYDINLTIPAHSFNAIIGASGSGKSTLLNIIGTLDKPSDGDVIIDGVDTTRFKKDQLAALRNQTIGFVFQFHYLLPEFTVLENVLMPYLIKKGRADKALKARAEELIDLVGLTPVKNNLSTRISGGQQQRAAIARALINNPRIILADEPTGNLDSDATETVYNLFRDINQKYETTFVVITHDRRIAEKTDRIVEIKDGRIEMDIAR